VVNIKTLQDKGIIKSTVKLVKILDGEIKKRISTKLPVSKSAKVAIEKAGGKIL
jgi:ribosomal protein L15